MKVETFLRIAKIPYETKAVLNPASAPRGKLPFIQDEGEEVCDSQRIVEHLTTHHSIEIDGWLTDDDRGRGHLVRRLLEESLYFVMLFGRWGDDEEWPTFKEHIFNTLPRGVRSLVPLIARRNVVKQLAAHGIGRRPRDEIYESGKSDIDAVASHLAGAPYILGDKISSFDAMAYSFLACNAFVPVAKPLREQLEKHTNLVEYCERLRTELYAPQ